MNTTINVSIGVLLAAIASIVFAPDAASAAIVASDNASNSAYSDGWQTGDNGGTGFGPWALSYSGNSLPSPPQFIDRAPLASNSLGAPSFALTTGDQNNAFETSEALRSFLIPFGVGQTLSANVDGSALSNAPSYTIGNTFDLLTANAKERFSLFTNNDYHSNRWTATGDLDTGIAAGASFHIEFTLTGPNTYNLVLSPVNGGAALATQTGATLAGPAGASITTLRIRDYGTGSSVSTAGSARGSKEYFFDDLMITAPGIQGDYNNDQAVNAADYVTWRDQINDGNYYTWRANFGQPTGASASLSSAANLPTAIPEPTEMAMLLIAIFVMIPWRLSARNSSILPKRIGTR